jgi:hypothetical protein
MPRRAIGNCLACKLPIWSYEPSTALPDGRLMHTSRRYPDAPERLGCQRYRPSDTIKEVSERWLQALRENGLIAVTSRAYSTADPLGELS